MYGYRGVDLSDDMLRVAKNKVIRAGLKNISLYRMDAADLRFRNESFDKILLSLVLHELDEALTGKILNEAKRILKPHGEIIITEWEPSRRLLQKLLFPFSIPFSFYLPFLDENNCFLIHFSPRSQHPSALLIPKGCESFASAAAQPRIRFPAR